MSDEAEGMEYKGKEVFPICGCEGTIVTAEDGTKHIEADCPDNASRNELAAILGEETILRVKPKVAMAPDPHPEQD